MNKPEKTCANCGYIECVETIKRLRKKGFWRLEDENIEIINGFAWRHICARWLPQCESAKEDALL